MVTLLANIDDTSHWLNMSYRATEELLCALIPLHAFTKALSFSEKLLPVIYWILLLPIAAATASSKIILGPTALQHNIK